MKVVSAQEMAELEGKAYRDGMEESEFMEHAGEGISDGIAEYIERYALDLSVLLLCGKGNNSGDAYAAAALLLEMDYEVTAIQVVSIEMASTLCNHQYHRFLAAGGKVWDGSTPIESLFVQHGVIVDGLFGTGFHGTVEEPFASVIDIANRSGKPILSIDIPSGLNGDTGAVEGEVILATETLFLELPKLGFFLRDGWDCVGKLRPVAFGLPPHYIEETPTPMMMLTANFLRPLLPKLRRSRHKYQAGYVVALAGSPEFPGAAMLSAAAALRGGSGIVRLLYPKGMEGLLTSALPELIKTEYDPKVPSSVLEYVTEASAVLVGPGLGRGEEIQKLLEEILPKVEVPCVVDADALHLLNERQISLPSHTILTPHRGELRRLLHLSSLEEITWELLETCQRYVEERGVTLLLKGGPTFIFHRGKPITVSPKGDPGMATAGSGDVLAGLIASFLAQGLSPIHASMMGVFVHGLAGEYAAAEYSSYCMIASDIMSYLPEAFSLEEV